MKDVSRRSMLGGLVAGAATTGGLLAAQPAALAAPPAAAAAQPAAASRTGRVREYWLQVEHQARDLAPKKFDPMMGMPIKIRTKIDALVYRAYTPGWGKPLPSSAELGPNTGFPGPVLRGVVGDTILVHLRNHDTFYKQPHSLHAHGVRYDPASDGGWTSDDHSPGAAVPVGGSFTYTFTCMPSSVGTWPYHDHSRPFRIPGTGGGDDMGMSPADPTMEIGAELGLMGHVIVEEPGARRADREIYLIFHDVYS